ncbi:MAG: hypothetical protein WCS37_22760, partial [Chloroflexota bacterium]
TTAAAKATTAAATAASTTVANAGPKKTAIAKATAPVETPSGKVTIPSAGSATTSDPFLDLLAKVTKASAAAKSAKLGIALQAQDSTGTVNELSAGAILLESGDFQMDLTANGTDISLISLNKDTFLKANGAWQKVTDPTTLQPFQFMFSIVSAYALPSDKDLQKFAGSTMQVYTDEKLDDGTAVGLILIDTSTATDASIKELGTIGYVYDKTTFQVLRFRSSSPTLEIAIIMTDYDDPSNKVTSPLG